MTPGKDLKAYYAARAAEYEAIYRKPERQEDLAALRDHLRGLLAGRRVLELACGTGHWTRVIARTAESVLATDVSEEMLAVARARPCPSPPGKVRFAQADAMAPAGLAGDFDAGLAAFWWSHVPRGEVGRFLSGFHAALAPRALVVFADNKYVPGSSTPIHRRDAEGNTYQVRRLDDGRQFEVRKNFPAEAELRAAAGEWADEVRLLDLTYYWCLSYTIGP